MAKIIYLAGGCFWGVEAYFQKIPGVLSTKCGYANGNTENPTYKEVCQNNTGHAETVEITYDEARLPLKIFFDIIFGLSIRQVSINKEMTGVPSTAPAFIILKKRTKKRLKQS